MHIQSYLERLHYTGAVEPNLATLRALQQAHLLNVPFENLDIHLGRSIVPDLNAFYDKIVTHQRGGFCYELNGLFTWLLRGLGFRVDMLNARVMGGDGAWGPEFDHMTLLVHLADHWLVDVGFGDSFRDPLRLDDPHPQAQTFGTYRVYSEAEDWILEEQAAEGNFERSYRFNLRPHELSDYAATCQLQQTPPSHFTQKRVCSLATLTGRITLSDLRLIVTTHSERTESLLDSEDAYRIVLRERFGVVY